ncbi:hypothetical protein [Saccharothrix hoggarensis]|uniref:Transposase n=1 Tax=Saccharothrix hoggarensis TaxID=913853 RepID=A0ABW3R392_9PSEU
MDTADSRLTGAERDELAWLRSENELLRVQRDILLRIATDYARDVDDILRLRTTDR